MTIEKANELAAKLKVALAEKEATHQKLRDEEAEIEERLKVLRSERIELASNGRALRLELATVNRMAVGGCQYGLRKQGFSGQWDSHDCKNKAKPNEELCGVHLAVKKREEERAKRYA